MTDEAALWKQRMLERKADRQTMIQWCRKYSVTKGAYHDRTEPFPSVLQVTWQDVTIHLFSRQRFIR